MTLGRLIDALAEMPQDENVEFDFCHLCPTTLASYRGYYERLALGFAEGGNITVSGLLAECRKAVGATFSGWKGGDYVMDRNTLVHVANQGDTSNTQIVRVQRGYGGVVLETAMVED